MLGGNSDAPFTLKLAFLAAVAQLFVSPMRLPKLSTHVFIAAGLLLFASISIAPYASRKQVIGADGAPVVGSDGGALTTLDTADMWTVNWLGYGLAILAGLAFIGLFVRVVWLLIVRFHGGTNESIQG
jgi:hypothetical protein